MTSPSGTAYMGGQMSRRDEELHQSLIVLEHICCLLCAIFSNSFCHSYKWTVEVAGMLNSSHPLVSLLGFVCVPQADAGSSCLTVGSTRAAVRRFRSLLPRSGARCLTVSGIRRVVLTVLSSFLGQSCLVFTNVTSALEVFLNVMRHINPRFTYLLTYLLMSISASFGLVDLPLLPPGLPTHSLHTCMSWDPYQINNSLQIPLADGYKFLPDFASNSVILECWTCR